MTKSSEAEIKNPNITIIPKQASLPEDAVLVVLGMHRSGTSALNAPY